MCERRVARRRGARPRRGQPHTGRVRPEAPASPLARAHSYRISEFRCNRRARERRGRDRREREREREMFLYSFFTNFHSPFPRPPSSVWCAPRRQCKCDIPCLRVRTSPGRTFPVRYQSLISSSKLSGRHRPFSRFRFAQQENGLCVCGLVPPGDYLFIYFILPAPRQA